MAIVISDTSPLRALAHLSRLDLLATRYNEVLLPPAVVGELLRPQLNLPTLDVTSWTFLRIQTPSDRGRVQTFLQFLDPGEAEALALAIELRADLVLLDEKGARNAAAQQGLPHTGTLGILIEAKRQTLIPAVRPLMERLINEINFFISQGLRAHVLRVTGE